MEVRARGRCERQRRRRWWRPRWWWRGGGGVEAAEEGRVPCGVRVEVRKGRSGRGEGRPLRQNARTGPMIVDCQWKRSSPSGPALQVDGGSLARSWSSFLMRLVAAPLAMADRLRSQHHGARCGRGQRKRRGAGRAHGVHRVAPQGLPDLVRASLRALAARCKHGACGPGVRVPGGVVGVNRPVLGSASCGGPLSAFRCHGYHPQRPTSRWRHIQLP